MTSTSLAEHYKRDGYIHIPGFLADTEVNALRTITQRFHESWLVPNRAFYQERAINSAYLTRPGHLNDEDRITLFRFIGSHKLTSVAQALFSCDMAFMNTQLFFNPANPHQKNYWHRDSQYADLSEQEQQNVMMTQEVIHCRLALNDEPGIEIIPGTHQRWDNAEELEIRMERNGKSNSDTISGARAISLQAGDLLIFSAHAIHRGLYGLDRFALDILFCDPLPELLRYADPLCLPNDEQQRLIEDPTPFGQARRLLETEKVT